MKNYLFVQSHHSNFCIEMYRPVCCSVIILQSDSLYG
uniref:Uncharacterized protein n=1 Tax=Ciona intestinalis TaxID=7719 RepID=H2XX30_CIOIN